MKKAWKSGKSTRRANYLLSEEDSFMTHSESKGSTPYINPLYKGLEALEER